MSHLTALIPAALLMAFAAMAGLPLALGAHPWWAAQVIWTGAPAGLLIALLAGWAGLPGRLRIGLFAVLAAASFAAATWGRIEFAASYAEDALAGRFWFFGWIGTAAAVAALLSALFAQVLTALMRPGRAQP